MVLFVGMSRLLRSSSPFLLKGGKEEKQQKEEKKENRSARPHRIWMMSRIEFLCEPRFVAEDPPNAHVYILFIIPADDLYNSSTP